MLYYSIHCMICWHSEFVVSSGLETRLFYASRDRAAHPHPVRGIYGTHTAVYVVRSVYASVTVAAFSLQSNTTATDMMSAGTLKGTFIVYCVCVCCEHARTSSHCVR